MGETCIRKSAGVDLAAVAKSARITAYYVKLAQTHGINRTIAHLVALIAEGRRRKDA